MYFVGKWNLLGRVATAFCGSVAISVGSAHAALTADEAKRLDGPELTSWGAEKMGSKDGSIPAYVGTDRPKPPSGYDPRNPGNMPDPYAAEKPMYSITAQNVGQYAHQLTDGQREIFKRYPNYRMDVYPTHRTTAHAPYILENTRKNATSCKAVANGLRLEDCYSGFPFPIPKTGNEAMWNHVVALPGEAWEGAVSTYVIDANGTPVLQNIVRVWDEAPFLSASNKATIPSDSVYWKIRFDSSAPARKVGEKYVFLDSLDSRRRVYSYIPGQRRVKLAPDLAYDTPSPTAGGAATIDEQRLFMGSQDRYDLKLIGKKEVLMMYNNFKMTDSKVCPAEVMLVKNFTNPDCVRWELHRAWAVEGTLKPGFRHVYSRRMWYFDEDSWNAGWADNWDAAGKIYRVDTHGFVPFYGKPYGQITDMSTTYDLQTGIWVFSGVWSFNGGGYMLSQPVANKSFFSPEALAAEGIR